MITSMKSTHESAPFKHSVVRWWWCGLKAPLYRISLAARMSIILSHSEVLLGQNHRNWNCVSMHIFGFLTITELWTFEWLWQCGGPAGDQWPMQPATGRGSAQARLDHISHGNINEINTWKCPTQTQCGWVIYSSFMLNIVQAVLTWGNNHTISDISPGYFKAGGSGREVGQQRVRLTDCWAIPASSRETFNAVISILQNLPSHTMDGPTLPALYHSGRRPGYADTSHTGFSLTLSGYW